MTHDVDNSFSSEDIETNIEEKVIDKNTEIKSSGVITTNISDYVAISKNFYAGFWIRMIGFTIDLIIVSCLGRLANTLTFGFLDVQLPYNISDKTLIFLLTYYLYFFVMTYVFSQTLGKMIIGIKVEKNTGEKLSLTDTFFREIVGRFLNVALLTLPFLLVAFTPKKKGLHDYIADSVVVKEDFSDFRMKLNKAIKESR